MTFHALAFAAWIASVAAGLAWVWDYETAPGDGGAPAGEWPAQSRIPRDPIRADLVMFVHPRCPCSRAGLRELAQILTRCPTEAAVHVVFLRPDGFPDGWERTDLWASAAALPGVNVLPDDDGRESEAHGAATSGHVLLYDRAGRLQFSGGITPSRGHSGDNAGRTSIIDLLTQGTAARSETCVFGCPLRTPEVGPR